MVQTSYTRMCSAAKRLQAFVRGKQAQADYVKTVFAAKRIRSLAHVYICRGCYLMFISELVALQAVMRGNNLRVVYCKIVKDILQEYNLMFCPLLQKLVVEIAIW